MYVPRDHVGHSSKHRSFVGLRSSSGANPLGPRRPHAHVGSSSRRFCLGVVGGPHLVQAEVEELDLLWGGLHGIAFSWPPPKAMDSWIVSFFLDAETLQEVQKKHRRGGDLFNLRFPLAAESLSQASGRLDLIDGSGHRVSLCRALQNSRALWEVGRLVKVAGGRECCLADGWGWI